MNLYDKLAELVKQNTPFVLATVVKTEGSVPGKVGFKMGVEQSGKTWGTVGGGGLERRVVNECLSRLTEDQSGLQEYRLSEKQPERDDPDGIPVISMMCNGHVWIYYEVSQRRIPAYIFGGGHVGQALSAYLSQLNFHVFLIDNREEYATPHKHPHAHKCIAQEYDEFIASLNPAAGSFAVILTHEHRYDYEIVKQLYQRKLPFSYVGVIASRSKAAQLITNLKKDLGKDLDTSALYTPIGLDIGGSSAAEIALSVAAEMQAIQSNRTVPHLRISPDKKSGNGSLRK